LRIMGFRLSNTTTAVRGSGLLNCSFEGGRIVTLTLGTPQRFVFYEILICGQIVPKRRTMVVTLMDLGNHATEIVGIGEEIVLTNRKEEMSTSQG